MNETFLNRNKKIDFIKKTPSFYNFIYLKEIIYLINKPTDESIKLSHNKYFESINEKYFNSMPKGIISETNLEKFKIFLKLYYDKRLDPINKELFELTLNYYLEEILKLPINDYIGDFFSLINNEENLIILPCNYSSDIKSLYEYFVSIGFYKLNFFTTKTKKEINYFNNSDTIKNNPFFTKFKDMIRDYDSKNKKNIYYLPCIINGGITNDELIRNLTENIDNINKIINSNYDKYMTEYSRKSSTGQLPTIYKNIYTFFDNNDNISVKLFEIKISIIKKTNRSITALNNDFLKIISNYDNKNFRKIVVQEDLEKLKPIDVNNYIEDSNYLKNKDIYNIFTRLQYNMFNRMATNTGNNSLKKILLNADNNNTIQFTINSDTYRVPIVTLCKSIYLYLSFCIKHFNKNEKVELLQTDKYLLKKLNIKYSMDTKNNNNKIFDVRYLTLPMEKTKTRKSYIFNFFNYNSLDDVAIYIISNYGPFNKLYITSDVFTKIKNLIPEISNNKRTIKNKNINININSDILFFIRLLYLYGIKSPATSEKTRINIINKVKKYIFKNEYFINFNKNDNIDLLIKIDKIENINSFKIFLHHVKSNSYIEISKLNGFLTEKKISRATDVNTFNISNIINKTVSDNIYYYSNFLIKPNNLNSYLKHKNLTNDLSVELLKILSDKNILEDFYIYNYLNDNLKRDYIDKKNEIIIINNIIKIIFSKNQKFSISVSKKQNSIQASYTIDSDLYKYKIENVSSLQNRLDNYPKFILNKNSKYYLYKDSKNGTLLDNIKDENLKKFYKDDIIIKNSPGNNYVIIKLQLTDNLKTNTNSLKILTCKEKQTSIFEKLKRYFDYNIIKNNITKKRIQYFGMGGSEGDGY